MKVVVFMLVTVNVFVNVFVNVIMFMHQAKYPDEYPVEYPPWPNQHISATRRNVSYLFELVSNFDLSIKPVHICKCNSIFQQDPIGAALPTNTMQSIM